MVLKTRDLSLFGIGATLYALGAYAESGLEVSLGVPLPLSAIVLGLMLGFMPLWCWGILYAYDVGTTVITEAVNYSKSLAFFTMAIEAAAHMPTSAPGGATIDPNLATAILYMLLSGALIAYFIGWIPSDIWKAALLHLGVTMFLAIPPFIFLLPSMQGFLSRYGSASSAVFNAPVEVALLGAQYSVLAGIWITLVAPFIAHLLFRRTALYRRLRAVNVF